MSARFHSAVVLAGGFGTRLRSVVSELPKPLAPVAGRPFVAYVLEQLAAAGVAEVVLAVGYRAEQVERAFGTGFAGMRITYSHEHEPLGTGGAVCQALGQLTDAARAAAPVLVANGDSYFGCDLAAFAKTHATRRPDVSLALRHMEHADRYGLVDLGADGRIARFREKRPDASGLINAGLYLLDPAVLLGRDLPQRFSLEADFFETHAAQLHLAGIPLEGYFIDIGIPEDYARAQTHFARGVQE